MTVTSNTSISGILPNGLNANSSSTSPSATNYGYSNPTSDLREAFDHNNLNAAVNSTVGSKELTVNPLIGGSGPNKKQVIAAAQPFSNKSKGPDTTPLQGPGNRNENESSESSNNSSSSDSYTLSQQLLSNFLSPISSFSSFLQLLRGAYGIKILILIFTGQHLLKGFVAGGGSHGLVGSAMEYFFKNEKVSGSRLQIYTCASTLPWALKAPMGLISDRYPWKKYYHKGPYILLASILAIMGYMVVGSGVTKGGHLNLSVVCFFCCFLQISLCDLMVEAKYSEKVKEKPEHGPSLISFVWGGISVWHMASTILVGYLIDFFGAMVCFWISIPFCCIILYPVYQDFFEEGAFYRFKEQDNQNNNNQILNGPGPNGPGTGHGGPQQLNLSDVQSNFSHSSTTSSRADLIGHQQGTAAGQLQNVTDYSDNPLSVGGMDSTNYNSGITVTNTNAITNGINQGPGTVPESSISSADLLADPANRPLLYLVWITFFAGIFTVAMSIFVNDIFLNFILAYSLGSILLISYSIVLRPIIAKMNLFFFLQNSLSVSVHGAAFYFFTDNEEQYPEGPHFEASFYVGAVGMVASLCSLLGMIFYNTFSKNWRYQSIILVSNILSSILAVGSIIVFTRLNVKWGISDKFFMVTSSALESVVFQFSWMPTTVLLAQLVPNGLESTLYALLAGSSNLARGMSQYSGAYLLYLLKCQPKGDKNEGHEFDNLWKASLVGIILPLITLLFIPCLIPDARQTDKLLIDRPESAIADSIWERKCAKRKGVGSVKHGVYGKVQRGKGNKRGGDLSTVSEDGDEREYNSEDGLGGQGRWLLRKTKDGSESDMMRQTNVQNSYEIEL